MITILLNNNTSRVIGDLKIVLRLRESIKVKSPGYFFSQAWRERRWDGYVRYVTEAGNFNTGMLGEVMFFLDKWKAKYEIKDQRTYIPTYKFRKNLGELIGRDYQIKAAKSILDNRVLGIKFQRGVLDMATNAGKNFISALVFSAFPNEKCLFLIDNTAIFSQAVEELEQLLPDEVGFVSSKKKDISKRVTVCMVQTLANLVKKDKSVRDWLAKQYVIVVDECDSVTPRKSTKPIFVTCRDSAIRIGMSGTPFDSKDPTRNKEVLSFFGPVTMKVTNKELVEEHNVSAIPNIAIYMGNEDIKHKGDYQLEKQEGIIANRKRNQKIWRIAHKKIQKNKGPVLILVQYHEHIAKLIKQIPKKIQGLYSIDYAHHKTQNRVAKFKKLADGKTDIFIASMIIKRGANIHIIRTLINGAGMDNRTNIKQILGRGLRKKGNKAKLDMVDFYDIGAYLQRHSKHRIKFYKDEQFEVKELYKDKLKAIIQYEKGKKKAQEKASKKYRPSLSY